MPHLKHAGNLLLTKRKALESVISALGWVCLVTPERLWIFHQLTGVQYVYLSQNAERTLLGHLSASAIFNNLLPCRCKNSIAKITQIT